MTEEYSDSLMHYGTKRHSGRYPWGSGDDPYQHSGDFLSRYEDLKKNGMSDKDIAKYLGSDDNPMTTTDLRTYIAVAKHDRRRDQIMQIKSLQKDGLSNNEIGRRMGINESSVRSLLNADAEARMNKAMTTAEMLKKQVADHDYVDIGAGTELYLGISKEKLNEARLILEADGYKVLGIGEPQPTNPGKQTNRMILCKPGTEYTELYKNRDKIATVDGVISYDGGETYRPSFVYPASLDSKRLNVVYAEDGGLNKDGLIEIRRGVKDLSLGNSNYAQVRVLVDGTHYLKGMAVYSDNLPDGIDIQFNTNKPKGTPIMGTGGDATVLKAIKKDPDNPFGSLIKEHGGQSYYDDPNGKFVDPLTGKKQSLSLINKRSDQGDWEQWSDRLSAQFLSKQSNKLVTQQLDISLKHRQEELDEINSLTNPAIKKKLLMDFADGCDKTAVHLDAEALPRQKYKVIIPVNKIKDDEVYAPTYTDGEKVALVRYPHGGTFEIPILTVNNKNREGMATIGKNPPDAIAVNSAVAKRLSGADFDGDTVMVIPLSDKVRITSTRPFKPFDPSLEYPKTEGSKVMKKDSLQKQMGAISNLITDMTIAGAPRNEIELAVRHSMVVVDAVKHELDYKRSEKENHIKELKDRYQGHYNEKGRWVYGTATIVSRAKNETTIPERKEGAYITDPETGKTRRYMFDPKTGEKLYTDTGGYYLKVKDPVSKKMVSAFEKNGKVVYKNANGEVVETTPEMKVKRVDRTSKSTQMADTRDAYDLVSKYRSANELAYAKYANEMKALANKARLDYAATPNLKYDPNANKIYKKEVLELLSQLKTANMNSPKERHAIMLANSRISAKQKAYPDMTKEELKKISQQELTKARAQVGAKRTKIIPTAKQWEAIQAGAISNNILENLLKYSDPDVIRKLATPRATSKLSPSKIARAKSLAQSGKTTSQIAESLGVSSSTISEILNGSY